MFTMDVPYVPAQETPVMLAQADAPGGATPPPDFILKGCQETESTGEPNSALRAVDPADMLAAYIENHSQRVIDSATEATIKTTLLEGTKHGNLIAGTSTSGRTAYRYDSIPNYTGNDRAIFLAEFEGKVYKIVVNLVVSPTVGETPLMIGEKPVCPPPTLIKVTKPTSGTSEYGTSYDLSAVSVSFADLAGAAIDQTIDSTIILDTNASGYGWFIGPPPPTTANTSPTPNEWVTKAGSAYGGYTTD